MLQMSPAVNTHLLHIIPVGDDAVLNGVLQSQDTPLALGLITDVAVLLTHTHHHTLRTEARSRTLGDLSRSPSQMASVVSVQTSAHTWWRGLPTMEGKTARGASSPANPALTKPEPLSHTRAVVSSSSHMVAFYWGGLHTRRAKTHAVKWLKLLYLESVMQISKKKTRPANTRSQLLPKILSPPITNSSHLLSLEYEWNRPSDAISVLALLHSHW